MSGSRRHSSFLGQDENQVRPRYCSDAASCPHGPQDDSVATASCLSATCARVGIVNAPAIYGPSPAPECPKVGQKVTFLVRVTGRTVTRVQLGHKSPGDRWETWKDMTRASGAPSDGVWTVETGPYAEPGTVSYRVRARDSSPQDATSETLFLSIAPESGPSVGQVRTLPLRPTVGDIVTISVRVTDQGGVDRVRVGYKGPGDRWENCKEAVRTAGLPEDGTWSVRLGPYAEAGSLVCRLEAANCRGRKTLMRDAVALSVMLADGPEVHQPVPSPAFPVVGETVTVNVRVTGEKGVGRVQVGYKGPADRWEAWKDMARVGGSPSDGTWSARIGPFADAGLLICRVRASDINAMACSFRNFDIRISETPGHTLEVFDPIPCPAPAKVGELVAFTVRVANKEGVSRVQLGYRGPGDPWQNWRDMVMVSGPPTDGAWCARIGPYAEEGILLFMAKATLGRADSAASRTRSISILPDEPPVIRNVSTFPIVPRPGHGVTISAIVTDDKGIGRVQIGYKGPGDHWEKWREMTRVSGSQTDGTWSVTIGPFSDAGPLLYRVRATDSKPQDSTSETFTLFVST